MERFFTEIPDPDAVVGLVEALVRHPWPSSAEGRDALFRRLGWGIERQFPANGAGDAAQHFELRTRSDGPPVFATSREMAGVLESIHLQLRLDSAPPDPGATRCFEAILSGLAKLHGEPAIPWHGRRGLRKMWTVNGIDIDVTLNDSRSSLMIGVQDERFFAEVEAYARSH